MRTVIFALLALAAAAAAQTTAEREAELAKLPVLRASVYGTPLTGQRELDPAMTGKSFTEARPIFKAAQRPVRMGESFQMTVQTAQGTSVESDPRTKYLPNGCLLVSASGFVTVAQTDSIPCNAGGVSELWVVITDATQAWNRYFFVITE